MAGKKPPPKSALTPKEPVPFAALGDERGYRGLLSGLSTLLEDARRGVARAANSILTTTYWEIGRRIVAFEQGGKARAEYGEALLHRLADDLTAAHGQGFSERNLRQMRTFYRGWEIWQTPSAELRARAKIPTDEAEQALSVPSLPLDQTTNSTGVFPLSWSHYVRLLSVENPNARQFYEEEAIRCGSSVRPERVSNIS